MKKLMVVALLFFGQQINASDYSMLTWRIYERGLFKDNRGIICGGTLSDDDKQHNQRIEDTIRLEYAEQRERDRLVREAKALEYRAREAEDLKKRGATSRMFVHGRWMYK